MKQKLKEKILIEVARFQKRMNEKKFLSEQEDKKKNSAMIRRCIEFCVEIKDSDFLFKKIFPTFLENDQTSLFAEELKPFILMGH